MPSLHHLIDAIKQHCRAAECEIPDQVWQGLAVEIRRQFAAQRVYIPPVDSRKDPARKQALRESVRHLPTGVAASRHNVSASYVRRVKKKGTNPAT